MQWLKDRLINLTLYGVIILGVGFGLYSAFLKPTNTQRTTNNADKIDNFNYWQGAKVDVGFGGCANFKAEKPREIK